MKKIIVIIAVIIESYSCSKIKEIPEPAGPPVPYNQTELRSLKSILDSVPDIGIYRALYSKSHTQYYIDSTRQKDGKTDAFFTLFVPRDEAWQAAGYTLGNVHGMDTTACDQLIMYLTVTGRFIINHDTVPAGGNTLFPVISPGKFSRIEYPDIMFDHFYSLNIAWAENTVFINGKKMASGKDILPARDGAVYLADNLVKKPEYTVYEILSADTSYSFYLAALEMSNAAYTQYQVGISPEDMNEIYFGSPADHFYNYSYALKKFNPNSIGGFDRFGDSYTVFAPDNNAFRKAGLADEQAIEQYIQQSYITTTDYRETDHAIPRYTNLDSVLDYSFMAPVWRANGGYGLAFDFEQHITNISGRFLFTSDMLGNKVLQRDGIIRSDRLEFFDWTTFDENTFEFASNLKERTSKLLFIPEGNRIGLIRGDTPGGKMAYIVPEHSNITALNGVVHRIDNLLLP